MGRDLFSPMPASTFRHPRSVRRAADQNLARYPRPQAEGASVYLHQARAVATGANQFQLRPRVDPQGGHAGAQPAPSVDAPHLEARPRPGVGKRNQLSTTVFTTHRSAGSSSSCPPVHCRPLQSSFVVRYSKLYAESTGNWSWENLTRMTELHWMLSILPPSPFQLKIRMAARGAREPWKDPLEPARERPGCSLRVPTEGGDVRCLNCVGRRCFRLLTCSSRGFGRSWKARLEGGGHRERRLRAPM